MFTILIDTCVWLDVAKDVRQRPLLDALERLVDEGRISLAVPAVVKDEFERHCARVAEESGRSLSGVLRRVSEAVQQFGDADSKDIVLRELRNVDYRIPLLGESANDSIARIRKLLQATTTIPPTVDVKVRAADRAMNSRAPFHRQRNSMADAVIVETYADISKSRKAGVRYAFVTHNTKDFSQPEGDKRLPHPDIASFFSPVRSLYLTTLGDALRKVDQWVVSEFIIEHDLTEPPRRLSEITDALDLLWHQVWYNRHQVMREKIEDGRLQLVERETFPVDDHTKRPIGRGIWKQAQEAAERVERTYGTENLGPWDDFEWGMINGKLSALRWVLGEEWDMLDT